MSLLKIKKKETKPDFPYLWFYDINIEVNNWDIPAEIPITEYISNKEGKSMQEEDVETLRKWREENPNWHIDVINRKIWKK